MLCNRVRKNRRHLRKWAKREHVTCYRLYDKDIPEIPIVIDWYDGRLHIAEYVRRDETAGDDWLDAMASAVAAALDIASEQVFVKRRARQRGAEQYRQFAASGERDVIHEGGHKFYINLSDYIDTGIFLDHRPLRARVQAESSGARVLNLFCYTAAFSVYAAAGGASSSLSIDLSNTYLSWAGDNFNLNELGDEHKLLRADVMEFLSRKHHGDPFDLAVVDPPTFSNSKKMAEELDTQRDQALLINGTLRLLRPGGCLYFSTNNRRFKLEPDNIEATSIEDISASTIPPDFRNAKIHRCWRIVKPS